MKTAAFAFLLLTLVPAPAALAHRHHAVVSGLCCQNLDSPVFWASRCDVECARFAITSQNKSVDLVLSRRAVALQLSDRVMHKLDRELRHAGDEDEDEGFLADAIKSAVIGGVRALLDRSLQCPLDELRDAEYRHGRLILTSEDGERVFASIEIDDDSVMESFSERDAHAFVREFRRLKGTSN
jgi:hypothetical protein